MKDVTPKFFPVGGGISCLPRFFWRTTGRCPLAMARRHRAAFSLVEVTLALGVMAFCLVPLSGLLPLGMQSNKASIAQTTANGILSAVITDLRAAPSANAPLLSATSQQFQIVIPGNSETNALAGGTGSPPRYFTGDGQCSSSMTSQAHYLLSITFLPNSGARTATFVKLQVSWPAAATLANAAGSVQTLVALDRN